MAAATTVMMLDAISIFNKLGIPLGEPQLGTCLLVCFERIHPRLVHLRAKEKFDRAICLLPCRDKWLEAASSGPRRLSSVNNAFFQVLRVRKQGHHQALRDFEGDYAQCSRLLRLLPFCPERLEIGELLKEPTPWDIIHPVTDKNLVNKDDTEFLHGGEHNRELAAHMHVDSGEQFEMNPI